MEELNPNVVAKRSIKGVFAFVSRSTFVSAVNLVRDITLQILLSPAVFGIYAVVESFITILQYFSDIGLAGALIQKKEQITQDELKTTFTIQSLLVLGLVIIILLFSNSIGAFFHFPKEAIVLLQAFAISFFLSSLKTIPSIILERNLEFGKFVIPQMVETIFYTCTVIFFALRGFGITSFTYAVLARGVSGLVAMYIICPWRVRFGFSKDTLSHLLSFGVPYQANSILALLKDNLIILFLGRMLPYTQVGYIAFAQKWAFFPLRLVMDNIIRVTFSSFSRLQHDKKALGFAFEKSVLAGTSLIFPSLVGLITLAPHIMHLFPQYQQKWEAAYISLLFFAANAALASVLVPSTNLLNAIGKIKITLCFMIGWTLFIWIATPIGISLFGFNSFAAITAVINVSVIPIVFIAKKYLDFKIFNSIKGPLFASFFLWVLLFFVSPFAVKNMFTLVAMVILGGALYVGLLIFIAKEEMLADLKFIRENLRK